MKSFKQIIVLFVVFMAGFLQAASVSSDPRTNRVSSFSYYVKYYGYDINMKSLNQKHGFFIGKSIFVTGYDSIEMVYQAKVKYGSNGHCVVGNIKAADEQLGLAVLEVLHDNTTIKEADEQFFFELPEEGVPLLSPGDSVWLNQFSGNAAGKVNIISIREHKDGQVGDLLLKDEIESNSDFKYCYQTDSSSFEPGLPVFNFDNVLIGVTARVTESTGIIVLPISIINELTPCPAGETLEKRYKNNMLSEIISRQDEIRARQRGAEWVDSFSECYAEGRVWDGQEWLDIDAIKVKLSRIQNSTNVKRRRIEYMNRVVYPTGCYEYKGHLLMENEYSEVVPEVQKVVIYAKPSRVTGEVADMTRFRSEVQQRNAMKARSQNAAMQRQIMQRQAMQGRAMRSSSRTSMPASSMPLSRMGGVENTTTFRAEPFNINRPDNLYGWLFTIDGLNGKVTFRDTVDCSTKNGKYEINGDMVWSGEYGIFKNSSGKYERVDLYEKAKNSDPVYIHAMYSPEPIDEHAIAWILYCQGIEQMLKDGKIEPQEDCECCGGTGWITCALCKGSGSLSLMGKVRILDETDYDQPVILGSRRLGEVSSIECPALCKEGKMACPECVVIDRPAVKNGYQSEYVKERR